MKLALPLALAALLAAPAFAQSAPLADDPATAARFADTITPQELAGLLYTYSDDYMAGRDTGDPGQRFAATFLAGQYAAMGIAPKGRGIADTTFALDPYMQTFELERRSVTSMQFTAMRGDEEILTAAIPSDGMLPIVPAFGSVPEVASAPVLFVGDGTAMGDLNVAGAFVIAMAPNQGAMQQLAGSLMGAGAAAVILPAAPTAAPFQGMAGRAVGGAGRLAMISEDGGGGSAVLLTGVDVAEAMVGGPIAEASIGDTGVRMTTTVDATVERVETENVIAFVEGSDLKDEFVVISAHLDHIGVGDEEAEDVIFNGADDDGSGTVTMLEIAEAFQAAKDAGHGPRRSVMFLHVTGEEKGLFGSEYYADRDPVVSLENTVANFNIDMVGRHDPERGFETTDYVYVIGGDLISQDIQDWTEAANTALAGDLVLSDRFNSLDDPNQFFRRSDHWNFGKHDIPFIFYFTGTHEDYHGVGDEPRKIDYIRMARIGKLIFGTAWDTANRDERPAVSGTGLNG